MGHDNQPSGVFAPAAIEVLGEPGDALNIEVVCRFVEHDHIEVLNQKGGKRNTPSLPARKIRDLLAPIQVVDKSGDYVSNPRVTSPNVLRSIANHSFANGLAGVDHVGLIKYADGGSAAMRDLARVGLQALRKKL